MKPGATTLGWLHFGTAATSVVLAGTSLLGWVPGWGTLASAGVGIAGHLVAGYLQRKTTELE